MTLADTAITAGVETFTLLEPTAGTPSFEHAEIIGGPSANSLTISDWSGSFTFDGAGDSDTLRGGDDANTWQITGANAGSLNSNSFSNVENLTGGLANDTFNLPDGGSLSGAIEGGVDPGNAAPVTPAVDTLDYSSRAG